MSLLTYRFNPRVQTEVPSSLTLCVGLMRRLRCRHMHIILCNYICFTGVAITLRAVKVPTELQQRRINARSLTIR